MHSHPWTTFIFCASFALPACGKGDSAATATAHPNHAPAASANCTHAACGEGYFVDAVSAGACPDAAPCPVSLKLVATGEFHVNDEYPYRFRGEATPGVEFLGTDPGGKNVFSKPAGDWIKTDPRTGIMTIKLAQATPGTTLSGIFKLSVCSAQTCLVDQPVVRAVIGPH